jgi:STE24 endopeptidase
LRIAVLLSANSADSSPLFDPEQVERGRRYHRPLYAALIADLALSLGTLALLAFGPVGDALHRFLDGLTWWLETPAAAVLVTVAVALVRLPLGLWRGWARERRWGLSEQSLGGFLADRAKAVGVAAVLAVLMLLGLGALVRLFPSTWPLAAGVAGAALVLLLGFVAPVLLEPLFNRFEPLRDEALAAELRALAERAGAPVRDVLVADASRRTAKANAYVSGLGATRRLVLYDTLLARGAPRAPLAVPSSGRPGSARSSVCDRPPKSSSYSTQALRELAAVVAHELGHRRERHVAQGTALGMAGAAVGVALLWALLGERAGEPRDVPLVLLILSVLELLALPATAAVSRRWERAADRFALRLTRDPSGLEAAFRRLAETNVADLDPPRLVRLLLLTHPPLPERIAALRPTRL